MDGVGPRLERSCPSCGSRDLVEVHSEGDVVCRVSAPTAISGCCFECSEEGIALKKKKLCRASGMLWTGELLSRAGEARY